MTPRRSRQSWAFVEKVTKEVSPDFVPFRRDPFEKAQHNATIYNDWFLSRVFVLSPMQKLAANFLMTMKDYPPSQTPGSFNLEKVQKQIESSVAGQDG